MSGSERDFLAALRAVHAQVITEAGVGETSGEG